MKTKICRAMRKSVRGIKGCEEEKSIEDFPLRSRASGKRGSICKDCMRKVAAKERKLSYYNTIPDKKVPEDTTYNLNRKPLPEVWAKFLKKER